MAQKSKAAVLTAPHKIELEEFPLPETGPDDALLRVEACGVCGADIGPFKYGQMSLGMTIPVILGHEIAGRIERLGARAAERWGVKENDRVIIERWIPCGHCDLCYQGFYRRCVRLVDGFPLFYGGSSTKLKPALWGGYSEYVYLHPDSVVYKVSEKIPVHWLPLFTPIGNGISWTTIDGTATVGSNVVIEGPGQEGMCAVLACKQAGAEKIIVTGLPSDAARLKLVRELGATDVLIFGEDDIPRRVAEITNGHMADLVLDVTTSQDATPVQVAFEVAAEGGTVIMPSYHDKAANFSLTEISRKVLTVKGVRGRHRKSVHQALRLLESKKFDIEKMCAKPFALEDAERALATVSGEFGENAFHISIMPNPEIC